MLPLALLLFACADVPPRSAPLPSALSGDRRVHREVTIVHIILT
jgi:hypothetical protein